MHHIIDRMLAHAEARAAELAQYEAADRLTLELEAAPEGAERDAAREAWHALTREERETVLSVWAPREQEPPDSDDTPGPDDRDEPAPESEDTRPPPPEEGQGGRHGG